MIRMFCVSMFAGLALTAPALAESTEFPVTLPDYPFQRSILTGESVVIPPYEQAFPVRIYTTPQRGPFYNVPPYAVIAPE